jgi:hypothetical protein
MVRRRSKTFVRVRGHSQASGPAQQAGLEHTLHGADQIARNIKAAPILPTDKTGRDDRASSGNDVALLPHATELVVHFLAR